MVKNYYYGNKAMQFSYVYIPKVFMQSNRFSNLSTIAKLTYGLLLDCMKNSVKNEWFDEENKVYVIYPVAELQEDLNLTKRKAMDALDELEYIGLIERKSRGLGLPPIIYVKNFASA